MADNKSHRITHKLVIKGTLTLASPLVMGKGEGDWVDKAIMRLPDGRPYIPASAFAGSLRSTMQLLELFDENDKEKWEWLWGTEKGGAGKERKDDLYQSHLLIQDLIPEERDEQGKKVGKKITHRDGIKINYQTGTVEAGAKYDYEILEPGVMFPLTIEITIREHFQQKANLKKLAADLIATIRHGSFRVGAFAAQGFGRFDGEKTNLRAVLFDFSANNAIRKESQDAWFRYLETGNFESVAPLVTESDFPKILCPAFQITARFRLKSALMIGASGGEEAQADKTSIQSNGHYVIPGKSIRGAIRHRALRILKIWEQQGIQLKNADGSDLTSELFGYVKQDRTKEGNARRSLIRVEETTIPIETVKPMLQNHIRIDRFTGGVIDGALFNSEPVWTTDKEDLQIICTIDRFKNIDEPTQKLYKKLLLMLLKDLWTGDLAIGGEKNVGRGVLQGKWAEIINNNKKIATFTWADEGKTAEALKWNNGKAEDINQLVA